MIKREDILSLEYIKKTEYSGSYQGMRYRLEKTVQDEKTLLRCTLWPEPYSFFATKEDQKTTECFSFDEEGICASLEWMNRLYESEAYLKD